MSSASRKADGTYLWASRVACVCAIFLAAVVTIASFARVVGGSSLELLLQGGVMAAVPDLAVSLQAVGLTLTDVLRLDLGVRIIGTVVFIGVGGFIAVKRFRDRTAVIVGASLVVLGVAWFAPLHVLHGSDALSFLAARFGAGVPFAPETGPGLATVMLVALLLVFPDGRIVPRWAWWLLPLAGTFALAAAVAPGTAVDALTWPTLAQMALVVGLVGAAIGAQLYRFGFRSSPRQRDQSRLVLGAVCALAAARLLLGPLNPGLGAGLSDLAVVTPAVLHVYDIVLAGIIGVAMLSLPASVGATILRHRLWDIDRIVSRTLAYGAVTGILVTCYAAVVTVVSHTFEGSPVAAMASATLAVALAFQPLRSRLQDVIDRRFYRQRYDATRTVKEFANLLREQVDLATLAEHTLGAVRRTVLPTGTSFWVPDLAAEPGQLYRIAFEPHGEVVGRDFDTVRLDPESIDALLSVQAAMDLREEPPDTAPLLAFRGLGIALAVPLVSQGELVGLINLGPRLSETDYSLHDLELLTELAGHAAAAVRVALLVRERETDLSARQRHESELAVATEIQRLQLPTRAPEVPGWWLSGEYRPASEVGGDFYDFLVSDSQVCIVAGDVTGHGVPSALVMATTQTMLRGEAPRTEDPAAVLAVVNDRLVDELPPGMFVTCLVAMLDTATGTVRIANAGHNLPYVRGAAGTREIRATGLPLGLMPDVRYECVQDVLAAGETMLLHSDGLAEAHGEAGMFGFPRVLEVFGACSEPSTVIGCLLDELERHTGPDRAQEDDISLVVVHREPAVVIPDQRTPAESTRSSGSSPS